MTHALGSLMVDLRGETLAADERELLSQPAVGAVILFSRNYRNKKQLRALTNAIKKIRTPALLIAVDQEGGPVQRFTADFHALPAAARIGEVYDRDRVRGIHLAQVAANLMALEVLDCGVDFSFAPVLDLQNPRSELNKNVIGTRAFHTDPQAVCELADAFITGMTRAGMAATGKHFPGHGFVTADSHLTLPTDDRAFTEMKNDLSPYQKLAPRLRGVMTAHIKFSQVCDDLPAYSKFWLTDILRAQLNFTGMIFSDDLTMKGAGSGDVAVRSAAALSAGCDMALICNDHDGAKRAAKLLGDGHPCDRDRLRGMCPQKVNDVNHGAEIKRLAELMADG